MDDLLITKVGHHYWVLGGLYQDEWNWKEVYQKKTSIFSLKRKVWFDGPNLPEAILNTYDTNSLYCLTSLSQTTVIFIGVGENMKGVILYDFRNQSLTHMKNTPIDIQWCSCSSTQGKDYNQ